MGHLRCLGFDWGGGKSCESPCGHVYHQIKALQIDFEKQFFIRTKCIFPSHEAMDNKGEEERPMMSKTPHTIPVQSGKRKKILFLF